MKRVLPDYGLPVDAAVFTAARIAKGADVEASAVVKRAPQSSDVDTEAHTHHGFDLARSAGSSSRRRCSTSSSTKPVGPHSTSP